MWHVSIETNEGVFIKARVDGGRIRAALGLLVALLASAADVSGQTNSATGPEFSPWVSSLPAAPNATMGSKLEKTFLKVDVLALTLRVDGETAGRITEALDGTEEYGDAQADAVAAEAIASEVTVAEMVFLRGASLDQFLDGIADDMVRAVDAGWLRAETFATLQDSLPIWFAFLEERKIHKGDRIQYHARADTLRTVFWGMEEEENLLDQTDVGRQRVMALLGAYFAPNSSFRKDLVESLWKGWDPENP